MDKITSLNLSFDRVLVQLLIPGAVALSMFYLILFEIEPHEILYKVNRVSSSEGLIFILLGLITGLFIENIGSRLEVIYYDSRQKAIDQNFEKTWQEYLQLSFEHEPVGQRYLRNIVFRMKFEISFAISLLIADIGFIIYSKIYAPFYFLDFYHLLVYAIILIIAIYIFFVEGWSSSNLLHQVRKLLVEKYKTS